VLVNILCLFLGLWETKQQETGRRQLLRRVTQTAAVLDLQVRPYITPQQLSCVPFDFAD
jgi:hypothetical protein